VHESQLELVEIVLNLSNSAADMSLVDLLKMLIPFLSGGVAGAFMNELFRRWNSRAQSIPLIERVNRPLRSELKGFALTKVVDEGGVRRFEEISQVREYQFTLRNTSNVHLHNAEIQFEFPTEDVEGWAERPVRSKTIPIPADALVTEPWKRGFRWRIPELPSTDSVEFTFRAVDAPSDEYEVALYGSGQVVVEKSKGEPKVGGAQTETIGLGFIRSAFMSIPTLLVVVGMWFVVSANHTDKVTNVSSAGCSLNFTASVRQVQYSMWPWQGPWHLYLEVLNVGDQRCFVGLSKGLSDHVPIDPGGSSSLEQGYSTTKPKLSDRGVFFGLDSPTNEASVKLYVGRTP
jgi:hypothetical protein